MHQRTFGKRNAGTGPGLRTANGAGAIDGLSTSRRWLPTAVIALAVLGIGGVAAPMLMSGTGTDPAPSTTTATDIVVPEGMIWVTSQRLARHSCPSVGCGVVGNFFYREGVQPLETKGEWTRVSKYYDASCTNGKSDHVDSGNAQCSQINGVVDGKFAEWVETANLSTTRPVDPAEGAAGLAKSIAGSDDFNMYRPLFLQIAQKLLNQRLCTELELAESGGFFESQNLKPRKAYFVRCGEKKYYADLSTMEIFQ